MQNLKTLISEERLKARIAELAKEISRKERIDVVVGVLTGAFSCVAGNLLLFGIEKTRLLRKIKYIIYRKSLSIDFSFYRIIDATKLGMLVYVKFCEV